MSVAAPGLVELFRSESREHLERLSRAAGSLASADGRAALDEAFRAAHTLKGMAAAMERRRLADLAHGLEHLLASLRAGVIAADDAVVGAVVQAVDELDRVIDDACRELEEGGGSGVAGPTAGRPAATAVPARHPGRYVRIAERRIDSLVERTGELFAARERVARAARESGDAELTEVAERLVRTVANLREDALTLRLAPIGDIADRIERVVRETARSVGKPVRLAIEGSGVEIDRSLLGDVQDLLTHLLRNAIDHGLEPEAERRAAGKAVEGSVWVIVTPRPDAVEIRVADDGRGVDAAAVAERAVEEGILESMPERPLGGVQLLRLLALPGFTTATGVTEISGRGVGLDHVASRLLELSGELRIETEAGRGTALTLVLPRTLSQTKVLVVRCGEERAAIPAGAVRRIEDEAESAGVGERPSGGAVGDLRVDLAELMEVVAARQADAPGFLVSLGEGEHAVRLRVEALVGLQDVVVRRYARPRRARDLFAGATILPDGSPCLVLEPTRLLQEGMLVGRETIESLGPVRS